MSEPNTKCAAEAWHDWAGCAAVSVRTKVTDQQIDKWFRNNYPHSIQFTKEQVRKLLES